MAAHQLATFVVTSGLMVGAESSANCVAQTAGARTQETSMYDITNVEKLSAFGKAVPEAMASFQLSTRPPWQIGPSQRSIRN